MKIGIPYIVGPQDFESFWSELHALFPDCRLRRSKEAYLQLIVTLNHGLVVRQDSPDVLYLNTTHGEVEYVGEVDWV